MAITKILNSMRAEVTARRGGGDMIHLLLAASHVTCAVVSSAECDKQAVGEINSPASVPMATKAAWHRGDVSFCSGRVDSRTEAA